MLTVAQGVLNAKGDKNQFTAQKEFIVIAVDNDFTFNNELRPDIPFQFLNRCFLVYDQAFTSCTPDDIENILRWHGTPIAVIGKRFMVKFQCHIPAPVMIFIRWFLSVWKIHNFDVSNPKMPLTQPQLEFAANKVFGHAQQMFAWYRWITQARPCLSNSSEPSVILGVRLIEIAVAEAQLMSCRKLNEFFMPPNPRFPDDLKSAVFGYAATGGFITDADLEELHKRVAHLTTRSAESDPVSYEIYDISHAALSHSFPFFKYLSEHFYTPNSSESRHLLGAVGILQKLWDEWSSKVGPKKRKIISA
jgi:hypothetical protein